MLQTNVLGVKISGMITPHITAIDLDQVGPTERGRRRGDDKEGCTPGHATTRSLVVIITGGLWAVANVKAIGEKAHTQSLALMAPGSHEKGETNICITFFWCSSTRRPETMTVKAGRNFCITSSSLAS